MEGNTQHFWCNMLYYFQKGKNATEMQKSLCIVYREGAVTDRTRQKWFAKFVLEISCWMMLPGRVDALMLIAIKSRHSLRKSTLYHVADSQQYSKYPNQ